MDLREVLRVVRKRWPIAVVGVILALGLAYETYAHRAASQYTSTSTVFVTQGQFPATSATNIDPGTLANLAYLYAQIAQSDLIRESIGAPANSIGAAVVTSGAFSTGSPLPFINITATAGTGRTAQARAIAATNALKGYVLRGEVAAKTPPGNRVSLEVITAPAAGKAIASRTRVVLLPGVVLLTILLATLGIIFMLENLSRGSDASEQKPASEPTSTRARWASASSAEPTEQLEPTPARSGLMRRQ